MQESRRERAAQLESETPLSDYRERFHLPDDTVYMDGNSLGPVSDEAAASLDRVTEEWRELLIEGWTEAEPQWFDYGERLGNRVAPLVGADAGEAVVANSTTTNVHTLIGSFLDRLAAGHQPAHAPTEHDSPPEEPAVLVNELDFPTDHYAIRAQLRARGYDPANKLRVVESSDGRTITTADVREALQQHDDIGIVFMPAVLYRSGQLLDIQAITAAAHEHGAYAGFDAAHSIGVVPHTFGDDGVDFAVWCSYKYLNAGPGAVAGLYLRSDYHGMQPALPGWWGHENETQFDMEPTFTPQDSAAAFQIGTIPMLAAAPLEGSLRILEQAGIETIRARSTQLTDFLIDCADQVDDISVGSPRDPDTRGGHVAIEHPDAAKLSRALRDRGIIVDYRPPNVVRVCPSPLYTRFKDVTAVVDTIEKILIDGAHADYQVQGGVT